MYIHDRAKSPTVSTSINSTSKRKFQSIVFQSSNQNMREETEQTYTASHSSRQSATTICVLNVMRQHTILCVTHAIALVFLMIIPLRIDIVSSQTPKFWIGVTISLVETNIIFLMFPCGKFMYQTICYIPHKILTKCTSSHIRVNSLTNQEHVNTITDTPTKSAVDENINNEIVS